MKLRKVITTILIFPLLLGQSGVGYALAPQAAGTVSRRKAIETGVKALIGGALFKSTAATADTTDATADSPDAWWEIVRKLIDGEGADSLDVWEMFREIRDAEGAERKQAIKRIEAVLPQLEKIIHTSENSYQIEKALQVLGRVGYYGSNKAVDSLVRIIRKSENTRTRCDALAALADEGEKGSKIALKALADLTEELFSMLHSFENEYRIYRVIQALAFAPRMNDRRVNEVVNIINNFSNVADGPPTHSAISRCASLNSQDKEFGSQVLAGLIRNPEKPFIFSAAATNMAKSIDSGSPSALSAANALIPELAPMSRQIYDDKITFDTELMVLGTLEILRAATASGSAVAVKVIEQQCLLDLKRLISRNEYNDDLCNISIEVLLSAIGQGNSMAAETLIDLMFINPVMDVIPHSNKTFQSKYAKEVTEERLLRSVRNTKGLINIIILLGSVGRKYNLEEEQTMTVSLLAARIILTNKEYDKRELSKVAKSPLLTEEQRRIFNKILKSGIIWPDRFHYCDLEEILDNAISGKPDDRPLALVFHPIADWNRAFIYDKNIFHNLIERGYQVIYQEPPTDKQMARLQKKITRKKPASLIIYGGHGDSSMFSLDAPDPRRNTGDDIDEKTRFDLGDEHEWDAFSLGDTLEEGGVIILSFCSGGAGKSRLDNMANMIARLFPQAGHVFSFTSPSTILDLKFDDDDKVIGLELPHEYDRHDIYGVVVVEAVSVYDAVPQEPQADQGRGA